MRLTFVLLLFFATAQAQTGEVGVKDLVKAFDNRRADSLVRAHFRTLGFRRVADSPWEKTALVIPNSPSTVYLYLDGDSSTYIEYHRTDTVGLARWQADLRSEGFGYFAKMENGWDTYLKDRYSVFFIRHREGYSLAIMDRYRKP